MTIRFKMKKNGKWQYLVMGTQATFDPNAEKAPKEVLEKEIESLSLSIQADGVASIVIVISKSFVFDGHPIYI